MNNKLIVKKLVSLNPTKYSKITLKKASEQYFDWVCGLKTVDKSFIKWLETEI